jgi:hypothetical protein
LHVIESSLLFVHSIVFITACPIELRIIEISVSICSAGYILVDTLGGLFNVVSFFFSEDTNIVTLYLLKALDNSIIGCTQDLENRGPALFAFEEGSMCTFVNRVSSGERVHCAADIAAELFSRGRENLINSPNHF